MYSLRKQPVQRKAQVHGDSYLEIDEGSPQGTSGKEEGRVWDGYWLEVKLEEHQGHNVLNWNRRSAWLLWATDAYGTQLVQ